VSAGTVSVRSTTPEGNTDQSRYELVLLNDMYTAMEFVIGVLEEVLPVTHGEATNMLSTHSGGRAYCGIYSGAEAQELANRIMERCRQHQYPLRCVLPPAPRRPRELTRSVARAACALMPRDLLPSWFRLNAVGNHEAIGERQRMNGRP
jgi:ATP-dependent Clp protease adaptor protein ClpS